MNVTIDDTSPLLQYVTVDPSKPWERDAPAMSDDEKLASYSRSTMSKTAGEGNFMSFTFNGTAVYVYGSKRRNHGVYSASIDGAEPIVQSGKAPPPGEFQVVLFQALDLDPDREHIVQVTNLPSETDRPNNGTSDLWLDIDFVTITAALPATSSGTVYTTQIDDTSPACVYDGDLWGTGPPMSPSQYHNSTAHITPGNMDAVTCRFNGTSVEVLGGLMSDHDNYTISIDDGPVHTYNGSYGIIFHQVTLFLATQLSDGPHTMRLTNIHPGMFVDLDYLVVNSTIAPPPSANDTIVAPPVNPVQIAAPNSGPSLTIPQLIGMTVGVVLGTIALLLAVFLLWRKRLMRAFRRRELGVDKISAIDLNGDEVQPYTAYTAYTGVSPITTSDYYDSKYSPDVPTPLHTAAAFFPYPITPPTAAYSAPTSSSLGRGRDLVRQAAARSDTSGGSTDNTDPARARQQPSDAGTFGPAPITPWQSFSASPRQEGSETQQPMLRGSTVDVPPPVPTSRTSFASLVRMYHQTRSNLSVTPEPRRRRTDSGMTDSTFVQVDERAAASG